MACPVSCPLFLPAKAQDSKRRKNGNVRRSDDGAMEFLAEGTLRVVTQPGSKLACRGQGAATARATRWRESVCPGRSVKIREMHFTRCSQSWLPLEGTHRQAQTP